MRPRWNHKFEIKPNRWVFVPNEETRKIGETIKEAVASKWVPPSYYAHLHKGGHVKAIKQHVKNKLFIRTDIYHFYNCISKNRISRNLKEIGFSNAISRHYAAESTVRNPSNYDETILPYGFIQSPIIASLCLFKSALGTYLNKVRTQGYDVTIYMDDIFISTNHSLDEANEVFSCLQEKAQRAKLPLNLQKTFVPNDNSEVFNILVSNGLVE
ncbi:MAG: reverse transcriptase domain-containing protein [Bdellovibrionales bacterium]